MAPCEGLCNPVRSTRTAWGRPTPGGKERRVDEQMLNKVANDAGFIAALDQSGGSTP